MKIEHLIHENVNDNGELRGNRGSIHIQKGIRIVELHSKIVLLVMEGLKDENVVMSKIVFDDSDEFNSFLTSLNEGVRNMKIDKITGDYKGGTVIEF